MPSSLLGNHLTEGEIERGGGDRAGCYANYTSIMRGVGWNVQVTIVVMKANSTDNDKMPHVAVVVSYLGIHCLLPYVYLCSCFLALKCAIIIIKITKYAINALT